MAKSLQLTGFPTDEDADDVMFREILLDCTNQYTQKLLVGYYDKMQLLDFGPGTSKPKTSIFEAKKWQRLL